MRPTRLGRARHFRPSTARSRSSPSSTPGASAAVKAGKKTEPEEQRKPEVSRKKQDAPAHTAGESAKRGRPRVASRSGDELGAAEVARRVAEGLKHFRKRRGLSLGDLATR